MTGDVGNRLPGSLRPTPEHFGGLVATNTSTPVLTLLFILVGEVSLGRGDDGAQLLVVLALHILEGEDSGGFFVNNGAETSLRLDNDVGDTHLAAQSGQVDDELDRVDIIGDDDKRSFLRLNESDAMVKTKFDKEGLLRLLLLGVLIFGGGLGGSVETSLLLLFGLRAVLVEQLEKLGGRVTVQSMGELRNRRRDLEALVQDDLLALETNVFGPFHETCEVTFMLNVLANSEIFRAALEERILHGLGLTLAGAGRGSSGLFSSSFFGGLVIETNRQCHK